ncbi:peptidase S8/S53 domain-containing protein [Chytriomyces sp. MP71]|nr:peptidase S8/S53 domain-containing protein [Chytriomyces sp. MP71]
MFGSQWHLINDIPGQVGNDHNVTGAWEQGIFGNGTIVCLVDDGLDYTALDLKDNYFAEGSYDFNAHTPDPLPKLALDRHGTRCAGEIAASTNNICGVGLAFKARVSAVRTLGEKITHADEAAAINYKFHENHIYSCSWGPSDSGYVMEAPAPLIQAALENGVQNGRRGLGSIYVFAAGNGGFYADNCNYDGFTNSIYTITVAAVTRNNEHPMYSESCSAVLVSMYSSSDDVKNDAIVTTDWAPSNSADGTLCTQEHGKTSAAAPLASAVYALVHSIRPDLTWRDFQHISVNSAVPFKTEGISWFRTHAGRWYSPEFGYGKLDAYAILEFAKTWRTVPPHVSIRTGLRQPVGDGSIPPRNENDSTILFDVTAEMLQSVSFGRLEYVQITVYIKHTRRGDVLVRLVSPNGVVSRLAVYRPDDKARSGFPGWTFSSVAHWDESPLGTWAVIADDKANHMSNGTFLDASLTFWGSKFDPTFQFVPAPLPVLIPTNVNVSVHGESAPEEWMWIYGGLGAFMLVGVLYALFIRRRRNATAGKQDMFTRLK